MNGPARGLSGKESACQAGDAGSVSGSTGSRRSPGEGNGKKSHRQRSLAATVHGVAKSQTWLSNQTTTTKYIHTTHTQEYYSATKKNEPMSFEATWMNPGSCLMFSDKLICMENHETLARIINWTHIAFLYRTKITFGGASLDAEYKIISHCCRLVAAQEYYRN